MRAAYSVLMAVAPWETAWIVADALDSLAGQSLQPKAVVVSCDGPPPNSLRQIFRESGLPVIVLEGAGREGTGPALQRGLQACPTDLVVRADADDLNLPTRCERLVASMEERPELAALGSWISEFSQRGPSAPLELLGERRLPSGHAALQGFSRWRNPLNHPATILRRDWVLAAGGYRAMESFEDYDLWLRLMAKGGLVDNLPETLVLARVDPTRRRRRRRGRAYLAAEVNFVMVCLRERLMQPWVALVWLLVRCPTRLLSADQVGWLMQRWLRKPSIACGH